CSLDELARWLGHASGRALIAHGARVVLARRELEATWQVPADRDRPPALAAELDRPGMLDAYRAARGIDRAGRPLEAVWSSLADDRLGQPWARLDTRPPRPAPGGVPSHRTIRVHPRAVGRLAELLGPEPWIAVPPPATASALLEALHTTYPAARDLLGPPERPLLSLWREGRRLAPDSPLAEGDQIDLVGAIAGG
ncbi:MAG: MoaD/ThiS family protein, partial [Planctomycetota bacterium]